MLRQCRLVEKKGEIEYNNNSAIISKFDSVCERGACTGLSGVTMYGNTGIR